jgi:recombination protein RecA
MSELPRVLATVNQQFGLGSAVVLDAPAPTEPTVPLLSSGMAELDAALGGGYPRGRIVELFGPDGGGKSTLALHAIAAAQKGGGAAAFIDCDHTLDPSYARNIGVDFGKLLVSQPDCAEQALEIVETLTRTGAIDLIVIDSVAGLVPKAELDGDHVAADLEVGLRARLMSQALRKLAGVAHRTGTCVMFLHRLALRPATFGNPAGTTGGNALKFYASQRVDVRRAEQVKRGEETVGARVRVKVCKNKIAAPFRDCELTLRWGQGFRVEPEAPPAPEPAPAG